MFAMGMVRCAWGKISLGLVLVIILSFLGYLSQKTRINDFAERLYGGGDDGYEEVGGIVPADLLQLSVYSAADDFVNEAGRVPPFWDCDNGKCNESSVWGPCYAPHGKINWNQEVAKNQHGRHGPFYHRNPDRFSTKAEQSDLSDYCKPGFLIIGAGKCGTSSLYHYLVSHPRVLPASEKQIHYFKYFSDYPPQWYYRHFPTATSFLASGALMTGEASPGYLPYPIVVERIAKQMPGPRIIAIGRSPLERMYSSYRYNYVTPTIKELQKGKFRRIQPGRPAEYYSQFLFTYEDMIRAELKQLKDCLAPTGRAVQGAREKWGASGWAAEEFSRRKKMGLPPLVDLDGYCYGGVVNSTVPRQQWAELLAMYPDKVISKTDVHLKQSLIGRSLYTLPLEWWYAGFRRQDIYFVCTEELSDFSGQPMNNLAMSLGLPSYNFSSIVQEGPYNVGGYRGYDKEMSWDEVNITQQGILPEDLQRELDEFLRPMNERLFNLIGKRCYW